MIGTALSRWIRHRRARAGAAGVAVVLVAAMAAVTVARTVRSPRPASARPDSTRRMAIEISPVDAAARRTALWVALSLWSESPQANPLVIVVDDIGRQALRAAGIPNTMLVPDIDAAAAAERARIETVRAQKPRDFFTEYQPFAAIDAKLDQIAEAATAATVSQIGASLQGRPIRALRISSAASDAPAFVINGGQHAREWISVMTTTCLADRLARNPADDPAITALLQRMQVYVVPVVNPDGYVYSWTDDRYWRKNRRREHGMTHGVDLNRNFPVAFGRKGSSNQPASPIYHGAFPFSEPEAVAMRDLLRRVPLALHIDFHSFSQLVLYPWSHTAQAAPDRARLAGLAASMATAIEARHGKRYEVVEGAKLYPASGTLMDWVYGERDVPSFVVELRPRRGDGFVLPPEQIVPTCEESLAAVLALGGRR